MIHNVYKLEYVHNIVGQDLEEYTYKIIKYYKVKIEISSHAIGNTHVH